MKTIIYRMALGAVVVLTACNKDEEVIPDNHFETPDFNMTVESVLTTDAAVTDAIESADYEADFFTATAGTLEELAMDSGQDGYFKSSVRDRYRYRYRNSLSPDVTVDRKDQVYPKTVRIDYKDGIELIHGRRFRGMIQIVISAPPNTKGTTHTITFTNFVVDSLIINGTIEKTYIGTNGERNIQIIQDLVITLPDGTELECQAEYVRTWVQGMDTPFVDDDDETEITGRAYCKDSDGNEYRREITRRLRRRGACRFITDGEVRFIANEKLFGIIDYGDGTCNRRARMRLAQGEKEFDVGHRSRERVKAYRRQQQTGQ